MTPQRRHAKRISTRRALLGAAPRLHGLLAMGGQQAPPSRDAVRVRHNTITGASGGLLRARSVVTGPDVAGLKPGAAVVRSFAWNWALKARISKKAGVWGGCSARRLNEGRDRLPEARGGSCSEWSLELLARSELSQSLTRSGASGARMATRGSMW